MAQEKYYAHISHSIKDRTEGDYKKAPFKFDWIAAFLAPFLGAIAFYPYLERHNLKKKFFLSKLFSLIAITIIIPILVGVIAALTRMNWMIWIAYIAGIPIQIFIFLFWGRAKANSWYARPWSCKSVLVESHKRILFQAAWFFGVGVLMYLAVYCVKTIEDHHEFNERHEYTSTYEVEDSLLDTEETETEFANVPTEQKFYSDDNSCSIVLDADYENLSSEEEGRIMCFYSVTNKPVVELYVQSVDECREYGITSPKQFAHNICETSIDQDSTFKKISEKKYGEGYFFEANVSGLYRQSYIYKHQGLFYHLILWGDLEDKQSLKEQMQTFASTFAFEN